MISFHISSSSCGSERELQLMTIFWLLDGMPVLSFRFRSIRNQVAFSPSNPSILMSWTFGNNDFSWLWGRGTQCQSHSVDLCFIWHQYLKGQLLTGQQNSTMSFQTTGSSKISKSFFSSSVSKVLLAGTLKSPRTNIFLWIMTGTPQVAKN